MTRDETVRGGRKVNDFAGVPGVQRVYARYSTLRGVTASSSSGYADSVGQIRPELGPASAVDGDPATYWRSAPFRQARGQWVQLDLRERRQIHVVTVLVGVDGFSGTPITRVALEVGHQRREFPVNQATGRVVADFSQAPPSDHVRVSVVSIAGGEPNAAVAIRDIDVAGLDVERTLVVPDAGADARTSFLFSSEAPRRACVATALGPRCDVNAARPGAEQGRVDRTFTLHGQGTWEAYGRAVTLSTAAASRLLLPLGPALSATANDVLGGDPSVSGMFAVDGRSDTPWLTSPGDLSPSLTVSWAEPRRIDRIRVDSSMTGALSPYEAVIQAGGETRVVQLGAGQFGFFEPITTSSATITFHVRPDVDAIPRPVGIGEVRLSGLEGLARDVPRGFKLRSACGFGPDIHVDGRLYRTRVIGTLARVIDGRPLRWRSCDGPLSLAAGEKHLTVVANDLFTPVQTVLRSTSSPDQRTAWSRTIHDASPVTDSATLSVGSGPESVLLFGQNANPGWRATLGTRTLQPVLVDGWQQGFRLPAGTGGRVSISFPPGTTYRIALGVGGLSVLLLLALLLLDVVRPRSPRPVDGPPWRRGPVAALLLTGLVALAALGGPVVAGVALAGAAARRLLGLSGPVLAVAGGLIVLGSGVAAVYSPAMASGSPDDVANVLAAAGVGIFAAAGLSLRTRGSVDGGR
jgi:arabinofuranan 3-O-arabinosyltransferase